MSEGVVGGIQPGSAAAAVEDFTDVVGIGGGDTRRHLPDIFKTFF